MIILIIFLLVSVIVTLIVYNIHIQKRIESFQNINERINNLSVLQDFMKLAGEDDSVESKLKRMNDIVIEKYDIKGFVVSNISNLNLLENVLKNIPEVRIPNCSNCSCPPNRKSA